MPEPISLGAVRVHFVYYETPREMYTLLEGIELREHSDPSDAASTIVLAVPDKLRAFLGWSKKGTPRPEIHNDVLVFQRPKA
ncbi:MAG TPA: hypothetical protein VJN96_09080 [Vicinamibacterales bacterium]|nr:hypothetical protein [Vicinamibacterales bacterium]